jgi:hypothetical protein
MNTLFSNAALQSFQPWRYLFRLYPNIYKKVEGETGGI